MSVEASKSLTKGQDNKAAKEVPDKGQKGIFIFM